MDIETRRRLFGFDDALNHPVTAGLTLAILVALAVTPGVIALLVRLGKVTPEHRDELVRRYRSWLVLVPLMVGPVLLGAAWTILAVGLLSLLCWREFSRATGAFRDRAISVVVVLGIVALTAASLDHWYGFFVALTPLTTVVVAAVAILHDQPRGYIQRVALGVLGFVLIGTGLGHLGCLANDADYRPMLLWLLLTVELNDVFAYITGKIIGGPKLCPNTSPKKTIAGAVGALTLTTALAAWVGYFVFRGTALDHPLHLVAMGLIIAVGGQLGDLMLSSIKRDVGIKDMGALFPGHGGLLDRFDSLLLVAPAIFHYAGYFLDDGIGATAQTRIFF